VFSTCPGFCHCQNCWHRVPHPPKQGDKIHFPCHHNPVIARVLRESQTEAGDTEAIHQEAKFYCAGTDSADLSPKTEPQEQRGLTLYTLASRLQKQEARFSPYMVACNSIGYFTPSAMRPSSCLDSFRFISLLCHPLPSATLSGYKLACFFSGPPSCYKRSAQPRGDSKGSNMDLHSIFAPLANSSLIQTYVLIAVLYPELKSTVNMV
jgi:hypothetical protein